ncbi:hypothetical protein QOZ80_1BG0072330 [Eleusine coracana subsp. coracana]|nr:hypothetical protein QOZ80_1BG0072330 [Eleusine coracana subsp. coracana]
MMSSSLMIPAPADCWVGDTEDYLSFEFDAEEYYYYNLPEAADDALQPDAEHRVSAEAGSNGLSGEASEQSQTDASIVMPGGPAGLFTHDKINDSGDGVRRKSLSMLGRRGKIAFKTRSEVDVLDDGYRWRKYGKKMVKNSPNPRNYYRCSSEGCLVKKRVERERDDARFVITTYDGVHNHLAAPQPPPSRPYLIGSGSS